MIDEKKLIEELEEQCPDYKSNSIGCIVKGAINDCIKIIKRQRKVGEWIPVTELDLDHNQEALIKLDDGFICSAKFLISDSGNNCGFYHKHIGFLQCPQVVAWMPYNAERGGKNE